MMYSLHNYDLKLAIQRGLLYVDILAAWSGSVDADWSIGDAYGMVVIDGYLYAAISNTSPGQVLKIDPATGTVMATITVGNDPRGLCFDGTYLWCANYDLNGPGNTVSKIDPSTDTVVATVSVGVNPAVIEYDGTDSVWVACFGSTSAYIINTTTNAVSTVSLGFQPKSVCYDNRAYMFFGSDTSTNIKRVRTTTKAVSNLAMPTSVYGLCSAGYFVWATDFNNRIYKINRLTLGISTIITPNTPTRRPAFDGKRVWVPCGTSGYVDVIDPDTTAIIDSVNTGGASNTNVAFSGDHAFVARGNGIARVPLV